MGLSSEGCRSYRREMLAATQRSVIISISPMGRQRLATRELACSPVASGACPQLEALDLAGCRLRQLCHEFDPARVLERRQARLDVFLQLDCQRRRSRQPRLEHDEGLGLDQL